MCETARKLFALMVALSAGTQANADDIFVRPEVCVRVATTQMDNCEVDNIYRCPVGADLVERTESFDRDGLTSVSTHDPLTGVSSTEFVWDDGSFRLKETRDSDAEIIRNGFGSSSAVGEVRIFGMWRPISGTGTATYSGETIELAGKWFHRIEGASTLKLPPPMPEVTGREVWAYSEELDLSVSIGNFFDDSVPVVQESELKQLSLPGQPGFGEEQPRYGCDTLSALPGPFMQRAAV